MSQPCCCKAPEPLPPGLPKPGRRRRCMTRALSTALSSIVLVLMPKCPLCLAAHVTFLTGLGLSATAARQLHTGLLLVCGGVLLLAGGRMLFGLWRWWANRRKGTLRAAQA